MKSTLTFCFSVFSFAVIAVGISSCTTRLSISTEPSDKITYQEVQESDTEIILAEETR